jgi:hypothetical protein
MMNATITITLPSELERVIAGRATASGKKLEEYALDVLRRDAELSDSCEGLAEVRDRDAPTAAWVSLSARGLAAAYGADEPEYSLTLLKESNPEYERG